MNKEIEKLNAEGTPGLCFHSWPGNQNKKKKIHSTLGLIFPMYEKQSWASSGPCALKHGALKACLLLWHSAFHRDHVFSSGFQTTDSEVGI